MKRVLNGSDQKFLSLCDHIQFSELRIRRSHDISPSKVILLTMPHMPWAGERGNLRVSVKNFHDKRCALLKEWSIKIPYEIQIEQLRRSVCNMGVQIAEMMRILALGFAVTQVIVCVAEAGPSGIAS